jgi:hypothetical protein
MYLLKRMPVPSALNPSVSLTRKEDRNILTLKVSNTVSSNFCGRDVDGTGVIRYLMSSPNKITQLGGALNIATSMIPIGNYSQSNVKLFLDVVRPKTPYDLSSLTGDRFDLRALAYATGAAFAAGSWEIPIDRNPRVTVTVTPSSLLWRAPTNAEIVVAPCMFNSSNDWSSFLNICSIARIRNVIWMGDTIPPPGRVYTDASMATYALRLYAWILATSELANCAGHHYLAFIRGMTSVLTVHGHNNEGGWVRPLLTTCDYPPSTGFLYSPANEINGIPLSGRIMNTEAMSFCCAMLLEFFGLYALSDIDHDGNPTMWEVPYDSEGRPSDVNGILDIYEHLTRVRNNFCWMYKLTADVASDNGSCRTYFSDNKEDRHFVPGEFMQAYHLIEPSAILSSKQFNKWGPCDPTGPVVMPLFDGVERVVTQKNYYEANNLPCSGSRYRMVMNGFKARTSGFSYIMSSAYNRHDGIGRMQFVQDLALGVVSDKLIHANPDATLLSQCRWSTPHCPLPNPIECMAPTKMCLDFTHSGTRHSPNLKDIKEGKVTSIIGDFRVECDDEAIAYVTSKHVPPHLRRYMEQCLQDRESALTLEEFDYGTEEAPTSAGVDVILKADPTLVVRDEAGDVVRPTTVAGSVSTTDARITRLVDSFTDDAPIPERVRGGLTDTLGDVAEPHLPTEPGVTVKGRVVSAAHQADSGSD